MCWVVLGVSSQILGIVQTDSSWNTNAFSCCVLTAISLHNAQDLAQIQDMQDPTNSDSGRHLLLKYYRQVETDAITPWDSEPCLMRCKASVKVRVPG